MEWGFVSIYYCVTGWVFGAIVGGALVGVAWEHGLIETRRKRVIACIAALIPFALIIYGGGLLAWDWISDGVVPEPPEPPPPPGYAYTCHGCGCRFVHTPVPETENCPECGMTCEPDGRIEG